MANDNPCGHCYPLVVAACDTIKIPIEGFSKGETLWLQITDKFKNVYIVVATVEANEAGTQLFIALDPADFPDGLFTPYSGVFTIQLVGAGTTEPTQPFCDWLDFTFCDQDYSCIAMSFTNVSRYGEVPTPPMTECICAYAIGEPKFEYFINNEGNLIVTLSGEFDGYASGAIVETKYTIVQYVAGVQISSESGTMPSMTQTVLDFGAKSSTLLLTFKMTFDDGAVALYTTLVERTVSGILATISLDRFQAVFDNCNRVDASLISIAKSSGAATFAPKWIDGELNVLAAGTDYAGDVSVTSNPDFDIEFVFGVTISDWPDLPTTLTDNDFGMSTKLVACEV